MRKSEALKQGKKRIKAFKNWCRGARNGDQVCAANALPLFDAFSYLDKATLKVTRGKYTSVIVLNDYFPQTQEHYKVRHKKAHQKVLQVYDKAIQLALAAGD